MASEPAREAEVGKRRSRTSTSTILIVGPFVRPCSSTRVRTFHPQHQQSGKTNLANLLLDWLSAHIYHVALEPVNNLPDSAERAYLPSSVSGTGIDFASNVS